MQNTIKFLIINCLILSIFSCRKDFDFGYSNAKISFSKDTVFLDTIFNGIRTQTYILQVYNNENKDVKINRIYLENLQKSFYKINIDGNPGNDFQNIPIRAKDSLYIFIELAVNNQKNETLIEEKLFFENNLGKQHVTLFAVAEDIELFKPQEGKSTLEITQNTTWENTKPKLIFDELKITNQATLTIKEGTKIYLHRKGKLTIDENSELNILGTKQKEVIFRGDRHDIRYDTLYGNWDKIDLKKNTTTNINYAKIQGGIYGITSDENTKITLKNTKFFNHEKGGILALNSDIKAENIVFNNCGNNSFYAIGGNYEFIHSTFANFSKNIISAYSIYLTDNYLDSNGQIISKKLSNANFENCIIYSSNKNSLDFNFRSQDNNYLFNNCLIKIQNVNNPFFVNSIFNLNPEFINSQMSKNNLQLNLNSPAIGIGSVIIANKVPKDIKENSRLIYPNLGAYQ